MIDKNGIKEDITLLDKDFDNKGGSILGILEGPVADFIRPTRNGRKYSKQLWKNVWNNEIVKELFENGGIPGELDHPTDREEICSEKIAILMSEPPKENGNGELIGRFNILNTPCGNIVYTLAKAGFKVGISSRGTGDTYDDEDGNEVVDEDTYDFTCFDVVLVPSVKSARQNLVTECLNKTYKNTINEMLLKAEDNKTRKMMQETLKDIHIKYRPINEDYEKYLSRHNFEFVYSNNVNEFWKYTKDNKSFLVECDDIKKNNPDFVSEDTNNDENDLFVKVDKSKFIKDDIQPEKEEIIEKEKDAVNSSIKENVANNDGTNEIIKNLQSVIKENAMLQKQVQELQEKLAVSNTKVDDLSNESMRYKNASENLSDIVKKTKALEREITNLKENLNEKEEIIKSQDAKIEKLRESRKEISNNSKSLTESLTSKDSEITELKESLEKSKTLLETKINELNDEHQKEIEELNEQFNKSKERLAKSTKIMEGYKKLANDTVERYIDMKATMLGVSSKSIKDRLNESYTLNDIDTICEDLQTYNLNVSKLPFNVDKNLKVRVTEAKQPRTFNELRDMEDDDISSSLLEMAGLID